jgi:hypothetical protein
MFKSDRLSFSKLSERLICSVLSDRCFCDLNGKVKSFPLCGGITTPAYKNELILDEPTLIVSFEC